MQRLKRYIAAIAVAAVAVVFLIIGVLALTLFRPAQELSSSVTPTSSIIMTRDGVLPLLNENVTVTAKSASGAKVALGLGTPGDVVGWIGDDSYTEVVGLASEREVLKTVEHAETAKPGARSETQSGVQSGAQSGVQSGAQSGAQSGTRSDPAQLVEALASSDMWLSSVSENGSATLELTKVPSGRSLIATSAGPANDLTLTLTWPTQRVNGLAVGSFLSAIVLALVAIVAFISRFHTLRNRRERAERLAVAAGADVTDTQAIDSARIAEMVEADRAVEDIEVDDEVEIDDRGAGTVAELEQPAEQIEPLEVEFGAEVASRSESEQWSDSLAAVNDENLEKEAEAVADDSQPVETPSDIERVGQDTPEETTVDTPEVADSTEEAQPAVRGRHGVPSESFDEDPPERVPTDTGIIDLSSVRPGAAFPSRRALKEARAKGEGRLVIGGREFDTGLIPVVDHEKAEGGGATDPGGDESSTKNGGWASLMSGWLMGDNGEEKR